MRCAKNPTGSVITTLALTLAGFWLVILGGAFDAHSEEGVLVDRIVAQVNNDIITLYELNRKAAPYIKRVRSMARPLDEERRMIYELREKVLNQMVDEKLTDQEIERYNIRVSEEAIDNTIEEMKKRTFMTDQKLRESLEKEGLTMEDYRERMKNQILRVRLVNREVKSKIVITDEDIRAYYEKNRSQYVGEGRVHLRHIVMALPSMGGEEAKETVRNKMALVREKAQSGIPFDTLAREYSESPDAKDGGELGTFALGDLAPQILNTISGLKTGEISEILETGRGLQLFFIEEMAEGESKSLEEVSAEIENILYDEIVNRKFMTWLNDLRERSHIKIIR